MKKVLLFLFAFVFATDSFATGIGNGASAPCDNATLSKYNGTADIEINWEPNTIGLKWYNGDQQISGQTSCVYDGTITVPPQPTKPGYTFNGWKVWKVTVPDGYTQLKYLVFSSDENGYYGVSTYIDTGIYLTNKHEIKVRVNAQDNFYGVMGRYTENSQMGSSFQFFNTYFRFGPNTLTNNINGYIGRDVTLTYGQNGLYVNDTLIGTPSTVTFTSSRTCLIGSIGTNDSVFSGKIYQAWIKYNGEDIANFIPARRNSDNVLGMWDMVRGQFFTNAGTGTLVAGPVAE